ncbi:hypothetical protein [Mesoplasma florum]|uniref:hypothetical protein n=1 Tax=Mesoplasma florum TaxID=2151 RepID=UPI000D0392B0|nr:hypothetical protein [Mesoplasma florum]AVN58941.1 hypothetical protein CG009_01720 [Mesoplasma florum]
MDNIRKKVQAGKTQIWNRPEKDVVYLISEFIDNSKSSYENLINKGHDDQEMIIKITLNSKEGYINISDKGEGFEILKSLESIGRDSIQIGKTNQYFVGMKSAMNFFGDFSIIISEREVKGENRRYVNYFIYNNPILSSDVEIKPTDYTGSDVYLFADYGKAKDFWRSLEFVNEEEIDFFPTKEQLDTSDFTNYSITMKILDNINESFPPIAYSLYRRYSFLVNKFPNIKIIFECLNGFGETMLKNNHNAIKINGTTPLYLKEISKNNYEKLISFSFDEFKKNNKALYKNILSDEEFYNDWKNYLVEKISNDMKIYFNALSLSNSDLLSKNEIGCFPKNFLWERNILDELKKQNKEIIELPKLENYPLAKELGEIFLNLFLYGEGNLFNINFNISNLVIDKGRKIITSRILEEDKSFDLNIKFNVSSNKYLNSEFENLYGDLKISEITGFQVIQNDRAIYHGPNRASDKTVSGNLMPENILIKELYDGNKILFPNSWTKTSGTEVKMGGNALNYMSKLYGEINLKNDQNFKSGTNKTQIDNLDLLKTYLLKLISNSGIAVLVKWAHLLDNATASKTLSNSFFDINSNENIEKYENIISRFKKGFVLPQTEVNLFSVFLYEKAKKEIESKELYDENGNANAEAIAKSIAMNYTTKQKEEFKLIAEGLGWVELTEEVQEVLNTNSKMNSLKEINQESVKKLVLELFRKNKNAQGPVKVIKDITLSDEGNFALKVKTNALENWNNYIWFKLNFDDADEYIKYDFIEDERIKRVEFELPLILSKYDLEEVENKIKITIENIIDSLLTVDGYFKIQKKFDKKNSVKIFEVVEAYLDDSWDKINKKIGNK